MELKPQNGLALLSKKTGAALDIQYKDSTIVVRTQDIESYITFTPEGVFVETSGEIVVGRFEEE